MTEEMFNSLDEYHLLQYENDKLRAEVAELREWIRQEGVNSDTCTYDILGEICEGCNCKRRLLPPAPTEDKP